MKTWSFYDPATGRFTGKRFTGNERTLEANRPQGLAAIEGEHDHLSRHVVDEEVVDWQPQQPDAEHEWNADSKRWQRRREVIELEERSTLAVEEIHRLEASQLRPMRELALNPANEDARERLNAIEQQIVMHRARL